MIKSPPTIITSFVSHILNLPGAYRRKYICTCNLKPVNIVV